ncbi:S8 family peptidase [Actinokineospora diospyrosa]|uniref:Serine protease, subtilisin family n=1 Tax=Actinokineospora diospyrosa TaxID=103728 RepID=A0ABT1IN34_9PSEU|nr:S8 family peptidase [Actinokineospora diospyrosa]MCP2274079.1 Serine protease, subtilisin family [Actinokineospora diospyrosa]
MDISQRERFHRVPGRFTKAGLSVACLAAVITTSLVTTAVVATVAVATPAAGSAASTDGYVVVLHPTATADHGTRVTALAGRYGAQVDRHYTAALSGFSARLTKSGAKALAADPSVAHVVPDSPVRAYGDQLNPPSWGLDRVDQRKLPLDKHYRYATPAPNVTAFILDTGVRATHVDFGGRVRGGRDFVDNDDNPDDQHGHGTFLAGIIGGKEYGLAKGVTIVPVRVLDKNGSGSVSGVIAGIDWITANAHGPSVVNMSLGGPANAALDAAVRGSIAAGTTYSVPAGSSGGQAGNVSPARVTEAITSASINQSDCAYRSSNSGPAVDLYAPGVNIVGPWITANDAKATLSGTSFAAAHTSGAAALRLGQQPTLTPAQVQAALVRSASPGVCELPANTADRILYTGPSRD